MVMDISKRIAILVLMIMHNSFFSKRTDLWGIEMLIERGISPQGYCKDLYHKNCWTDGWLVEEEVSWLKREMRIDRVLFAWEWFMNEGNVLKKIG